MTFLPKEFMDEYDLHNKIHDIHIYNKIQGGLYVLPQSGKLTNNLLKKRLAPFGYTKFRHTPGLQKQPF